MLEGENVAHTTAARVWSLSTLLAPELFDGVELSSGRQVAGDKGEAAGGLQLVAGE